MSYCRFSTDDFDCDVYVYESREGWVTHVAAVRVVPGEPFPPRVEIDPADDPDGWARAILARQHIVHEILDASGRTSIGLPRDGESFVDDSPGECATTLQMLADAGYRVPGEVLAVLYAEQADLGGCAVG